MVFKNVYTAPGGVGDLSDIQAGTPTDGDWLDGQVPIDALMAAVDAIDAMNEEIEVNRELISGLAGSPPLTLSGLTLEEYDISKVTGRLCSGGGNNFIDYSPGDEVDVVHLTDTDFNLLTPAYTIYIDSWEYNNPGTLIVKIDGVELSETLDLSTLTPVDEGAPFTDAFSTPSGLIQVKQLEKYNTIYVRGEIQINLSTAIAEWQVGENEVQLILRKA